MVITIEEKSEFHYIVNRENLEEQEYQGSTIKKYLEKLSFIHGVTLQGNQEVIKKSLNIRQMVPVCLKADWEYMLFPIIDKQTKLRIWINYGQIDKVKHRKDDCEILFLNGYHLQCHVSKRSFERQMDRCYFYLYLQYCFVYRKPKKLSIP